MAVQAGSGRNHDSAGGLTSAEIVFENLTRQFPKAPEPAVNHVSFKVSAGDLVVLLGPSGCGKTTLLKMVNRLYEPTDGKIWINGKEIHELGATELRRQIGYVIQQVGLFPHMTIAQNISVVPRLLGWNQSRIDERVKSLLTMVGLPETFLKRFPRQLSGGEQQRIGLARALAADPVILLMDEPFAAVDAINRERLQNELLAIQQKVHKTVLFVTHDVEEAFRLADKILIIQAGRLVQYGTPLEIVTHPANSFVQDLVGAGNILRQMSLIDVKSMLGSQNSVSTAKSLDNIERPNPPAIHLEDDLRSVITIFLESGADTLKVINQEGQPAGEMSLDFLRAALIESTANKKKEARDELPDQ